MKIVLLGFLLAMTALSVHGQKNFYSVDTIQNVEIFFEQENWSQLLDTAKNGKDGYALAKMVKVNGVSFDSVGIKYKGNSSYSSGYKKNPLHLALDEFKDQAYLGITDIKLGNAYADPSMVREVMAYKILGNYMHCPRANFAKVYVNGIYLGVYSSAENIDKEFCSNHFYSSKRTFVKCNPTVTPSAKIKSNLRYISTDSSAYATYYELKSSTGWKELINLCDTITNFPSEIHKIIDVDRVLWMLAFNNLFVNLDSYSGAFAQNYYLYRDKTGHFNPIVWDLNMAFGGFPFLGNGNTSLNQLPTSGMQQLPTNIHASDNYWPLIKAIMSNPLYKRKYIAHMRTMLNENVVNNTYKELYTHLQAFIESDVLLDTNKFFSDEQFSNSGTQNIAFNSYAIPGLSTLMTARSSYLLGTSEFMAVPPTIRGVMVSSENPKKDSVVYVYAETNNALEVFLAHRVDKEEKFEIDSMYDDGTHGDIVAHDGVFTGQLIMETNLAEYYVYADNLEAGVFAPTRAEHEFYSLVAATENINKGEIVINEFLANNKNGISDENGAKEDWIELFNNSDKMLNLMGHHLSDDKQNLKKFTFSEKAKIPSKGFLTLWADEDANSDVALHVNFKLSTSGEAIYLSTSNGVIIDSVSFGTQIADVSTGRCPDGVGAFGPIFSPTYNLSNVCTSVGVEDAVQINNLIVTPNPASDIVWLKTDLPNGQESEISIFTIEGNLISKQKIYAQEANLDLKQVPNGLYVLKCKNRSIKLVVMH